MFGYIKKDKVLEIIEREKKRSYDTYLRYMDSADKLTGVDAEHHRSIAIDSFSEYQECAYLIARIKNL